MEFDVVLVLVLCVDDVGEKVVVVVDCVGI